MSKKGDSLLVKAIINDGESGEVIETVRFIYALSREVSDVDDLSANDVRRIEKVVNDLREYESADGDIYRVDCVILENPADDEDDGAQCVVSDDYDADEE